MRTTVELIVAWSSNEVIDPSSTKEPIIATTSQKAIVLATAVGALVLGSLAWIAVRRAVRGPRPERAERRKSEKPAT